MFGSKIKRALAICLALAMVIASVAVGKPETVKATVSQADPYEQFRPYFPDGLPEIGSMSMFDIESIARCTGTIRPVDRGNIIYTGDLYFVTDIPGFKITAFDEDFTELDMVKDSAGVHVPDDEGPVMLFFTAPGYYTSLMSVQKDHHEPYAMFYGGSIEQVMLSDMSGIRLINEENVLINNANNRIAYGVVDDTGITACYYVRTVDGVAGSRVNVSKHVIDGAVFYGDTLPIVEGKVNEFTFTAKDLIGNTVVKNLRVFKIDDPEPFYSTVYAIASGSSIQGDVYVGLDMHGRTDMHVTIEVNGETSSELQSGTQYVYNDSTKNLKVFGSAFGEISNATGATIKIHVAGNLTNEFMNAAYSRGYNTIDASKSKIIYVKLNDALDDSYYNCVALSSDVNHNGGVIEISRDYFQQTLFDAAYSVFYAVNAAVQYCNDNSLHLSYEEFTAQGYGYEWALSSSDTAFIRTTVTDKPGKYYVWYRVYNDSLKKATEWKKIGDPYENGGKVAVDYNLSPEFETSGLLDVDVSLVNNEYNVKAKSYGSYNVKDALGNYNLKFIGDDPVVNGSSIDSDGQTVSYFLTFESKHTGVQKGITVNLIPNTTSPVINYNIEKTQTTATVTITPNCNAYSIGGIIERDPFDASAGVTAEMTEEEKNQQRIMYYSYIQAFVEQQHINSDMGAMSVYRDIVFSKNASSSNPLTRTFRNLTPGTNYLLLNMVVDSCNNVAVDYIEFTTPNATISNDDNTSYPSSETAAPAVNKPEEKKEEKKNEKPQTEEEKKAEEVAQVVGALAEVIQVVETKSDIKDADKASKDESGKFVKEDGTVASNEFVEKGNGKKSFAGDDGKPVKKTVVTTGDELFFCDKKGNVVQDQVVKLPSGDKMIASESGSLITDSFAKVNFGGKTYVTKENGVLASKEFVTLDNGKMVFANKNGKIKIGTFIVDGEEYKTNKNGFLKKKKVSKTN